MRIVNLSPYEDREPLQLHDGELKTEEESPIEDTEEEEEEERG